MYRLAFLLVLLFPVLANAQAKTAAAPPPKVDYRKTGAVLAPFRIQNEKGAFITNANITPNKPVIMMIFSPECEHCLHLLDSLKSMVPIFNKYQTVLITEKRHEEEFKKWRKGKGADIGNLFHYSGWDLSNFIYFIYNYRMLPQINIYNSKQKLVQSFSAEFPLDSLRMYVK